MSFFQSHNRSFKAEWLKMKHTGMLWLCFGAAIFVPLISTLVLTFVDVGDTGNRDVWNKFIEQNFGAFTPFFYPLFLILVMGRLVYMEHRSDTWKLLETQPVSRQGLFLVKFEAAAILSLLCLLGVLVFSLIGGLILQTTSPKYEFAKHSIDWTKAFSAIFRLWVTGLTILSAQYFIGLLIKSFAWPMGIGLFAVIAGSILKEFSVFPWWPYMGTIITASSYNGSVIGNFLLPHEKLSLLWTASFLLAGYAFYSSRTFKRAFLKSPLRIGISLASILIIVFLAPLLIKPVTVGRYHKTILAGTVNDKTVKDVVLMKGPALDTVIKIPVIRGNFNAEITESLPAGQYYFRAGQFRGQVFMGDKDSTFIEVVIHEKNKRSEISGTRMAENAFFEKYYSRPIDYLKGNAFSFSPTEFAHELLKTWDDEVRAINNFKTDDQVRPSDDFLTIQKKLIGVQLLGLADHFYPAVFSVYHPNETLKFPASLNRLRKEFDINDVSLVSFPAFRQYVKEKIMHEYGKDGYLTGLKKSVTNPEVKLFIIYDAILNEVLTIRDSMKRDFMFAATVQEVNDDKLKQDLIDKAELVKKNRKGNKAGNISAVAINDAPFTLNKFKDRYIVLDVWATWCNPCLKEAPYFEELAERYTGYEIAFVSLSVDEKKDAWKMAAAQKKNKVLQLWATKVEEELDTFYSLNTIPRFMLIDNRGNIVNSDMPPPSDPEFEAILLREIPSLKNN